MVAQRGGCWQKKDSAMASHSEPSSRLTVLSERSDWVASRLKKKWPLHLSHTAKSETHTHTLFSMWSSSLSVSPSEHDECASGQDLCDENAICTNTIRGHLCTCKPGYVGNGTICRGKFLTLEYPTWHTDTETKNLATSSEDRLHASLQHGSCGSLLLPIL